jgi:tetratricopeptide (TPR) repeat protein
MLRMFTFCLVLLSSGLTAWAYSREDCLEFNTDQEKTINVCTEFIAKNPGDPQLAQAYAARGKAFERANNLDLAIADYSRAIELAPSEVYYFNIRGTAHQSKGDLKRAAEDFRRSVTIDPTHHYAKGRLEQLNSAQQQDCKKGTVVSISAVITSLENDDTFLDVRQNKPGCKIYGIIFEGDERPSTCVVGATVSATGPVHDMAGPILQDPKSISCK